MGKRAEAGQGTPPEMTTPHDPCECPTCGQPAATPKARDRLESSLVETAARAELAAVLNAHPFADTLSATVLTLARALDNDAGLSAAAVAREVRAQLAELARIGAEDDDLDAELSGEVRNS